MGKRNGFKGFNKDMTCLGMQYKEGETYEIKDVRICKYGFHACGHPTECFRHYPPHDSVYHEVVQEGTIQHDADSTKAASSLIAIKGRIGFGKIAKKAVSLIMYGAASSPIFETGQNYSVAKDSPTGEKHIVKAAGVFGIAASTSPKSISLSESEHYSVAVSTGGYSASRTEGWYGAAVSTGVCGASVSDERSSLAAVTGTFSVASAEECGSVASATGMASAAYAKNVGGVAVATGVYSAAVADGECGAAFASMSSVGTANGRKGIAAATGYKGTAEAAGSMSAACATGENSTATANHAGAVAVAWGHKSSAQGATGSTLVLTEWEDENAESPKHVRLVHVDGEKILPNIRYTLVDGEITVFNEEDDDKRTMQNMLKAGDALPSAVKTQHIS